MARKRGIIGWAMVGFVGALVVLGIAVVVLTRTAVGVQTVGGYLVRAVGSGLNGQLEVGGLSSRAGLLGGVTLHDVRITGPSGRQFLDADSVALRYDWLMLVSGRVVFDRVDVYGPRVVLEQLPGDTLWNFNRILAGPGGGQSGGSSGPGSLIVLGGLHVHGGDVTVRMPWDTTMGPPDTTRYLVARVPGGLEREMRFQHVEADIPRVLVSSPLEPGQLVEIRALAMRAQVWRQPLLLRDLHGTLGLRDSVVSFRFDRVQLPHSHASLLGHIVVSSPQTRMDLQVDASRVALADLHWLSPDLPAQGSGHVRLRIQTRPDGATLYLARDLLIQAPDTRISGSVGLVLGDSTYFTEVDLDARPLNMELLEKLIPVQTPLKGLRVGGLRVRGPGH